MKSNAQRALEYVFEHADLPVVKGADWTRVYVCGVHIPAITTAATFPGHEFNLLTGGPIPRGGIVRGL